MARKSKKENKTKRILDQMMEQAKRYDDVASSPPNGLESVLVGAMNRYKADAIYDMILTLEGLNLIPQGETR